MSLWIVCPHCSEVIAIDMLRGELLVDRTLSCPKCAGRIDIRITPAP